MAVADHKTWAQKGPKERIEHDFLEEIMTFKGFADDTNTAVDRYAIYEATGLQKYKKDPNVKDAAIKICKEHIEGKCPGKPVHADTSILLKNIWETLWCGFEKQSGLEIDNMDTMNSPSTTINRLMEFELGTDEKSEQIKKLREVQTEQKICFYYPQQKRYAWAEAKSVLLYLHAPELLHSLLKPAQDFCLFHTRLAILFPFPPKPNITKASIQEGDPATHKTIGTGPYTAFTIGTHGRKKPTL